MNLYFLVEGKTEMKVYDKWLSYLLPSFTRIHHAFKATKNNFYIFNGHGFPSILTHLQNAIEEVNDLQKFQYLILCLDADELSLGERKQEIMDFINHENIQLFATVEFVLLIQNRCIETWGLGNSSIFKKNVEDKSLRQYLDFYDIR